MRNHKSLADQELVQQLSKGAIGVMPTDTVYGLVCEANIQEAVMRLYKVKHRENKPGTIIAASVEQLVELGLKKRYLKAVEQFWPGPVTVIVPTDNTALTYLDQGVGSLAVRVVDDPRIIELLEQTGPLLTSSANKPGEPPATTIAQAKNYFGDTIDDAVEIVRQGAVQLFL